MKHTILSLLAAAAILTGCNVGDDITKDLQEIENTTIDFSYTIDGQTVTFTNQSDDKVRKCFWDFGDNYASEAMHQTTHTYSKDGTYTVYLKASWIFNNHYLSKTCEKSITISSATPQPVEYSHAYISGFVLYATADIPGSYYYRFECGCNDLWGHVNPNIKTDYSGIKLNSGNIPYTMLLNPAVELAEYPNPFDCFKSFDIRVLFASNIAAQGVNILDERIQASDIPDGATEYIVTNSNNGAKVGILFSYR